jgi:hypothetical protein
MRKNTLRVLSRVMCLILLASVVLQAPLMAVESIPVRVGGQTFNVTPGQWVSVRSGTHVSHYNVRFVNGRPVALEMSQYTKLVFGNSGSAGAAGSVADDVANAGSTADDVAAAGSTADDVAAAGSVADDVAASPNPMGGGMADDIAQSGSVADDVAQAGSVADDVAQAGSVADDVAQAGSVADDVAQAGSVADDVAQAGSVADDVAQAGSVADDVAQAGSVADDVAQAGSVADDVAQAGSVADDVAAAGSVADDVAAAGSVADDVAGATSQTTTQTTQTSQTTQTTTTWDPSRHPRDPQTGRFISHEEAIKRGLMDPPAGSTADDVAQAGSTADDVAQAGSTADDVAQAGSTADDVAQAGSTADDVAAAGSVADDAAQASGKPGFKETVKGKFQSGYYTGKGMVNQGFQNVKTSLKSGFSAKNLLVTAGITVGVDLATQIMRGEKPSAKKALKTVCSAEFVGGVGGAVLGAAGGSFFVPFLSAVPVVGGALSALAPAFGSIVGSSMGAYLAGDLKNGRFSIKEAFKRIDWVGVTGQAIGSTVGAALGSALGPIGTIAGGIVGGYAGNWAAQKIAGMFGKGRAAQLPEMNMPTGTGNPMGGYNGGEVTIGGDDVVDIGAGPVADEDILVIDEDAEVVGDYESEVALAYSKYQELYKLYNEMLRQGRREDALSVAEAMNEAKKEYDELKGQAGK